MWPWFEFWIHRLPSFFGVPREIAIAAPRNRNETTVYQSEKENKESERKREKKKDGKKERKKEQARKKQRMKEKTTTRIKGREKQGQIGQ